LATTLVVVKIHHSISFQSDQQTVKGRSISRVKFIYKRGKIKGKGMCMCECLRVWICVLKK
jgi:hypothetical protein